MFEFNLQTVLNLKEKTEDLKKRELGKVTAIKNELVEEKENVINQRKQFMNKGYTNSTMDILQLRLHNQYKERLEKDIQGIDKKIEKTDIEIENKRKELLSAVKERKVLDTLKQRRQEDFRQEELRSEQKDLDELVSFKFTVKEREIG